MHNPNITFDSHPLSYVFGLEEQIESLNKELKSIRSAKPQFLIDDDEYQDQLELSWYKSELRDEIKALEKELDECKSKFTLRQTEQYKQYFSHKTRGGVK